MQHHLHRLDAGVVRQHDLGDLGGDRLDQVSGRAGDNGGGMLGEFPVVQRCGQIIGLGRGAQIHPDGDVDNEVLAVSLLEVEHSVIAEHGQATQFYAVAATRTGAARMAISSEKPIALVNDNNGQLFEFFEAWNQCFCFPKQWAEVRHTV